MSSITQALRAACVEDTSHRQQTGAPLNMTFSLERFVVCSFLHRPSQIPSMTTLIPSGHDGLVGCS